MFCMGAPHGRPAEEAAHRKHSGPSRLERPSPCTEAATPFAQRVVQFHHRWAERICRAEAAWHVVPRGFLRERGEAAQITTNFDSPKHNLWLYFALISHHFEIQLETPPLLYFLIHKPTDELRNTHLYFDPPVHFTINHKFTRTPHRKSRLADITKLRPKSLN